MTLDKIWNKHNRKQKLKVRYQGWDHSIKYFTVFGINVDKTLLFGELDNGETASFPITSDHWCEYHDGLENNARAS
jgi:hypothetical protein